MGRIKKTLYVATLATALTLNVAHIFYHLAVSSAVIASKYVSQEDSKNPPQKDQRTPPRKGIYKYFPQHNCRDNNTLPQGQESQKSGSDLEEILHHPLSQLGAFTMLPLAIWEIFRHRKQDRKIKRQDEMIVEKDEEIARQREYIFKLERQTGRLEDLTQS